MWSVYASYAGTHEGEPLVKVGCTRREIHQRVAELGTDQDVLASALDDGSSVNAHSRSYFRRVAVFREPGGDYDEASDLEQRILCLLDDAGAMCPEAKTVEEFFGQGRDFHEPGFTEVFLASYDNWISIKCFIDSPATDQQVSDFVRQIFQSLFERGYLEPRLDDDEDGSDLDEELD